MVHFIEKNDGQIVKVDGDVNPGELGPDVEAAYTVAQVFSKKSVFVAENLVPKTSRRIRTATGELKHKEDLTQEELDWYLEKRRKEAAARKVAE